MNKPLKRNIKLTILEHIELAESAVSHQDLQKAYTDLCNRVTIYRTLDKLVDEGRIHKIVDIDGVSKFAACHDCVDDHKHEHAHIHFSCKKCQTVTCLDQVIPSYSIPKTYAVEETNFTISGVCPSCNV